MSDDIIETLHNLAQTRTYDDRIGRALRRAADEIERLRAELDDTKLAWQERDNAAAIAEIRAESFLTQGEALRRHAAIGRWVEENEPRRTWVSSVGRLEEGSYEYRRAALAAGDTTEATS